MSGAPTNGLNGAADESTADDRSPDRPPATASGRALAAPRPRGRRRVIGMYVHHHGSGHLHRALQIAAATDDAITGLSSLPRPADWQGEWIELPLDTDGATDHTASGVLHWAPLDGTGYATRMRVVADWITRAQPDLVYVDVSVEVTLLARLLGVRVAVAAMRGDRGDRPHTAAYDAADVLVAPWPAALPEPGWPARWAAKTVHTGGISRFDAHITEPGHRVGRPGATRAERAGAPAGPNGRESGPARAHSGAEEPVPRRVGLLWGRGGGAWGENDLAAVRAQTPGWEWEVLGTDRDVWDGLVAADVVVTHAGQNAVAEVAAAARPAVVVAAERPFGEQHATAAALGAAGLAVTIRPEGDTPWVDVLERAARADGSAWRHWSDGHGAHRAAAALEAAARGRCVAAGAAVVTLVQGRHDHLLGLLAGLVAGTHLPERLVVVALDDPDVDDLVRAACAGTGLRPDVVHVPVAAAGLPLARARNVGAATARAAGCHTLVFLDVDCIPGPTLVRAYAEALAVGVRSDADYPRVFSGPTTYLPPAADCGGYDLATLATLADPHPARPAPAPGEVVRADDLRLFWSLSFALSSEDFTALGGFDEAYAGYGGEDTDFAMRLQAAHGSLFWLGGADAYHQHHPTQRPPTQHLVDIVRNANLFAATWGWHPMQGWLAAFAEAGLAHFDTDSGHWEVCRD